jgi:hypothetical protein
MCFKLFKKKVLIDDSKLNNYLVFNEKIRELNEATYNTALDLTYDFKIANVVKVYDGDTITIATWINNRIIKFNARIYGVDCCELKDNDLNKRILANNAKDFVTKNLLNKIVKCTVLNNKKYNNKKQCEKYNRLLVIIHYKKNESFTIEELYNIMNDVKVDNLVNLADELINNKLGVKYLGGTK